MATRLDPATVVGVDPGIARAARAGLVGPSAGSAAARTSDAERLIGERRSRWWGLAGAWLAMAFSVGFGLYVNYEAQGLDVTFLDTMMAMIPHYCFWVLVSPPLYRALHLTIQGPRRALWISTLLAWSGIALTGSTAMSFFSYIVRHDLRPTLDQLFDIYFMPPAGPAFWAMNFSILVIALAAFAAIRSHRLRLQSLWDAAQTELRGARLEVQLADARLLALQAQINPHFLLNSLNAIASLVQCGERDRAFDAIGRLGELLRMAMKGSSDLNVSLGDEMDFLRSYLKLCKLRFDQQFQYCISMPEELAGRRVPALIVQPLIENSIRHGMEASRTLNVDVRVYVRGGEIVIEVEDDGRGIGPDAGRALPAGHGLANVSERLRLSFGPTGRLSLEPRAPRGTVARIVIDA
jgi:two-component system LytT family sensor kinase